MIQKGSIKLFFIVLAIFLVLGFMNYGVSVEGASGMTDISSKLWGFKVIGYSIFLSAVFTAIVALIKWAVKKGARAIVNLEK